MSLLWIVILDFDRTLFDTSAYYADFLEWLTFAHDPAVAQAAHVAERKGEFDIFSFLETEYNLSAHQVQLELRAYLSRKHHGTNHSYLLPGAASLIKFLQRNPWAYPVIWTTGSTVHQEFKLSLCSEVLHIPARIISGNKGQVVQEDLDIYGGVVFNGMLFKKFALVDDKSANVAALKPARELADRSRLLFHVIRKDGKDSTPTGRIDINTVRGLTPVERTLRSYLRYAA
ncbi:MAG: hypothetical protein NVSMB39_2020 [Candidatus Saccharimonadales bacterium]